MDVAWDEYKPILRRAYFGDSDCSIASRDSDVCKDFWTFFNKYLSVVSRKGIKADRSIISGDCSVDKLGIHLQYNKLHKQSIRIALDKPAKYILREVPSYVIKEFEYILHAYLDFCQREKLKKLKQLRAAQKALPITAYREKILETLAKENVLIIAGDTGCGKSTQVPQYLLGGGFEHIACTQPRRIACISLSKRVGYETLREYGSQIAYQIRFERTKTAATRMLFLTEGLLLRQLGTDPQLSVYQVIILDEVHERHLQGDFLMGLLKQLVTERNDLKLILMSATINLQLFTKYFQTAPVIQVPGRLFSIDLKYFPPARPDRDLKNQTGRTERIDPGPYLKVLNLIDDKVPSTERGDVLVFLSGISEISTVAEALKVYAEQTGKWIVLLLHSTLSLEEQDKVFDVAPEGVRKCVLSTNIAETSVTIDGVRFVLDSGKMKQMRYDTRTRMHHLEEIWVSKANAEQRKGRAGRTGPGICYRLYSQEEFAQFDEYSTSEIRRVSLDSLLLQMYHLQLPNPRHFDFIEPPASRNLEMGIEALKDHGALRTVLGEAATEELTPLGKMLVNLPVDVSIGKALVMGCLFQQVEAVLTVAAGLSVQSPFTQRSYRDLDCIALRENLMSNHGDAFALLKIYREWLKVKAESAASSRKWCQRRGLEEQRLYEITKLRRQFRELLEQADLIERKLEAGLGSAERRIRLGEMKRLRELKRKGQQEQRKQKVLKLDQHDSMSSWTEEGEEKDDEGEGDVSHIEFRMRHSDADVDATLHAHRLSHDGVTLIKLILCSALYPQYGLLDPHNTYKQGCDQMLHAKSKPFVVLHPNSCLAQEPDCLEVIMDRQGRSTRHQAVFYSLLLETTKPYVVNSIRVQALHTLLLFSRQVDSSEDFTRIVCDQFAEFHLAESEIGEKLVSRATEIRKLLGDSLQRKLEGDTYRSDSLASKMLRFMSIESPYSIKRLVQIDNDSFFDHRDNGEIVAGFLSMGSVPSLNDSVGTTSEFVATKWECPKCNETFYSNSTEKLKHIGSCTSELKPEVVERDDVEFKPDSTEEANPLKKPYSCAICGRTLKMTPVEFLKHKRSCLSGQK